MFGLDQLHQVSNMHDRVSWFTGLVVKEGSTMTLRVLRHIGTKAMTTAPSAVAISVDYSLNMRVCHASVNIARERHIQQEFHVIEDNVAHLKKGGMRAYG